MGVERGDGVELNTDKTGDAHVSGGPHAASDEGGGYFSAC